MASLRRLTLEELVSRASQARRKWKTVHILEEGEALPCEVHLLQGGGHWSSAAYEHGPFQTPVLRGCIQMGAFGVRYQEKKLSGDDG